MKIKISKFKEIEEIIDIDVPYYYRYDWGDFPDCVCGTSIVYGKITADNIRFCIEETKEKDGSIRFDIASYIQRDYSEDELLEKYKSTKEEFEAACQRAEDFLDSRGVYIAPKDRQEKNDVQEKKPS